MDAVKMIEVYDTLFKISVGITVLGFGLAVFFFFFYQIPDLRAIMTGKAKAETVRRMEERNAMTGSLRGPMSENVKGGSKKVHTAQVITAQPNLPLTARMDQPPAPEQDSAYNRPETSVLSVQTPETSVLGAQEAETSLLVNDYDSAREPVVEPKPIEYPNFNVTESTMVIHTDEII